MATEDPEEKKPLKFDSIFKAKKQFHIDRARLPIEEKIKILVQLQRIANDISTIKKDKEPVFPAWNLED